MTPFFFNPTALSHLARRHREAYQQAKPFPHVVFDDFLPRPVVETVLLAFPGPSEVAWHTTDNVHEKKLSNEDETKIPPVIRQVLHAFNSQVFVNFLEELTGISGLISDPHFRGGGLHQIASGGKLGIHVDFNRYKRLNLERRLNVLLYLNKDWKEEYGGHLELWNQTMTTREKKILPIFNRCVIFTTSEISYHGHPTPLRCPPEMSRKSLALYYYTADAPSPDARIHSTIFQARPGEHVEEPRRSWKQFLKRLLPPIALDIFKAVRRR
ncbi:2OG-Fe(II) oxygenase [Candidatus Azambacteria bacterium]|nr:2OG-Fe(II) oxygenase [Candidatus Azambacteria bacterium]